MAVIPGRLGAATPGELLWLMYTLDRYIHTMLTYCGVKF